MPDDYTPTTGEIRSEYVCKLVADGEPINGDPVTVAEASAIFDRWLSAYTEKVRAEWEAETDEDCPIGFWPVRIQRLPLPDTTNNETGEQSDG